MPTTTEKIATLQQMIAEGKSPAVCEILSVYWDGATTHHYAIMNYSQIIPHRNCSLSPIEPRLLGGRFHAFEINSDLQTENINFEFDNIDGEISSKFQTYGEGVRCELFYYYADVDLLISAWWGQLKKPENADMETLPVQATNGYRSREGLLPYRIRANECQFTFGGLFTQIGALETNGCPYDRHLGGSLGLLTGGAAFEDCPRLSESDCTARFGNALFYGGFRWDVASVVTDQRTGYSAVSKGSGSTLKQPIRVIFGTKTVNVVPQLFFRREINQNNPDHSFVRGVFEVCEGPVKRIYNITAFSERKPTQQIHLDIRTGQRGQSRSANASNVQNLSYTAHYSAAFGWINAASIAAGNFTTQCTTEGYNQVKVYTDTLTSSRVFNNNRAWCLLELYTNKRFGKGYDFARFDIQSFIDTADWTDDSVRFVYTDGEGVAHNYDHVRTRFDCVVEGRPAGEVISDICRSGRISIPFQSNGQYKIKPFAALDAAELSAVPVFTDKGSAPNIITKENGKKSSLRIVREVSNRELANKIILTYEDGSNHDTERPLTISDQPQMFLAGRANGDNVPKANPKNYFAFGCRTLNEAMKLAHSLLWFGEFDEGGTKNNLRIAFNTAYENILTREKYDVIKIDSDLIAGKGYTDPFTEVFTPFTYFRILSVRKNSVNECEVTAQAFNEAAYDAFETSVAPPAPPAPPAPIPSPCVATVGTLTYSEGFLSVPIEPCV